MTILPWVVALIQVLGILSAVRAVMDARTPQGAIAWAIALVTLPYVALPLFWIFGKRKFVGYVIERRSALSEASPIARRARQLLAERGLLVTRLWYIREVDPYEKIMTGMTRDGLFLVENGRVTGAVRNFRFNQSIVQMFADAEAYSAPVRVTSEGGGALLAPAIRCKAFRMSSKSDAV